MTPPLPLQVGVFVGGAYQKEFRPGDHFGEMSLLTGAPRNATIRARGRIVCLKLTSENWEAILGRYTEQLSRGMRRRLLQAILTPNSSLLTPNS